jgi:uncharacterized protein YkwD
MRALSLTTFFLCARTLSAANARVDVVTLPPSVPSDVPEFNDTELFTSAVLNSTNTYRSQHNASDVTWNDTLADFASDYLEEGDCEFEHSGGPYGENLAMGYGNATASVEAWGNERDEYDFDDGEFSTETGHFTQLVWKNTTDVGCGRRLCGTSGWFLVCEYWPPGNVIGEFVDQVQSRASRAVTGWADPTWLVTLMVLCMIGWS